MNRSVVLFSILGVTALVTVIFYASYGCTPGRTGPNLSGTVTLDGQPVQNGSVVFTPDISKDNDGPSARGTISDGTFTMDPGSHVTAGANIADVIDSQYPNNSFPVEVMIPDDGSEDLKIDAKIPEGMTPSSN